MAEKRVALVIGNSNYQHVPNLSNPVNDAGAIVLLLKSAGFDIVEARDNLGVNDMRRIVRDFSDRTRDADIAVIYYAGHGMEVGGINYLVPIDATLRRDIDVEDETISLDRLLQVMEPAKRLRLVILDACRDNPFVKSMSRTMASRAIGRGLARVEPTTSDTLIAFAAKAGLTAADGDATHSPFTSALLRYLVTPGLDIRLALGRVRDDVMKTTSNKQEPFVYGSLGGTTVTLAALTTDDGSNRLVDKNDSVARDYEAASKLGTKEAWQAFLEANKEGLYAALARQQFAKLAPMPTTVIKPDAPKTETSHPKSNPTVPKEKPKQTGSALQQCLAAYVRQRGPFVPEGSSDKVYKSRSDMTGMCNFAIAHGNYYWRR